MFVRHLATTLAQRLAQFPVVTLLGPRQVGKTTLARLLADSGPTPCLYLDLELPSDAARLAVAELYLAERADHLVMIDEVQRMPELFPLLRSLVDQQRRPGRFLLLGSAAPTLARSANESLAGRISHLYLGGISLTELGGSHPLTGHWFRGGFPEALTATDEAQWSLWMQSYLQSYVERDLPLLGLNARPTVLYQLLNLVAHAHGNIWNQEAAAKALQVTGPTVARYIDFLEETFFITRLRPYFNNAKKRLVKAPKLYLRDSGLLHTLLHISHPDMLYGHPALGASWEGYALEQIRLMLPNGYETWFYRTQDGSEADLVITRGLEVVAALEFKFSTAPSLTRGNTVSFTDLGARESWVVVPTGDAYPLNQSVRVAGLEYLLRHELPRLTALN